MESILTSVKKLLGIEEEYEHFDPELIMHINSVFMILTQMGVGPSEGFSIQDAETMWTEFIPQGSNLEALKTYIHHKVKLMFDPPSGSAHIEALNRTIAELEWRLNIEAEKIIKVESSITEVEILPPTLLVKDAETDMTILSSKILNSSTLEPYTKFKVVINHSDEYVCTVNSADGFLYIGANMIQENESNIVPDFKDKPFIIMFSIDNTETVAYALKEEQAVVAIYGVKEGE